MMKTFPASDLARRTADLLEAATLAPVAITKHGKARFVVMSMKRFQQMTGGASTQRSFRVAEMPDDMGQLLDKGIEAFLRTC